MNNDITEKDRLKACMMVSPFWTLIFALSAAIGIGRALYVYLFMEIDSGFEFFLEAIGLFTPWFNTWIAMLIFGVLLATNQDKVDSMAKQIASSRQVTEKE